jgi:hypothetical protein
MLRYIKRYPFSLLVISSVIYLSFFRPPSTDLNEIPYLDKVVHVCMYAGMSGMLWLEFLRNHRKFHAPLWHAWVGGLLCPVLFSGCVELLQGIAPLTAVATGSICWQMQQGLCWFRLRVSGYSSRIWKTNCR